MGVGALEAARRRAPAHAALARLLLGPDLLVGLRPLLRNRIGKEEGSGFLAGIFVFEVEGVPIFLVKINGGVVRVEHRRGRRCVGEKKEKKAEDLGWDFFCLKLEVWWDEHV